MKSLLMHMRTARMACSSTLLFALLACDGGKPAQAPGMLDLGGGISMTADGVILGATGPWPPSLPADDAMESGSAAATDSNPYPPGVAEPFYFRSASQWQPYADKTVSVYGSRD